MSLEEEITINQFGQGTLLEADLLDSFTQLDTLAQRKRFVALYFHVSGLELVASDVDQALADCSLTIEDPISNYLNLNYLRTGSRGIVYTPYSEEPPGGNLERPFVVLLYVFKANYQRRYTIEKNTSTKWWYRDFSKNETKQDILETYQKLVEETYANASFRSEFLAMAKLFNTKHQRWEQAKHKEPPARQQTHFNFITYDQIGQDPDWIEANHTTWACHVLLDSVGRALSAQYGLDVVETRRLTLEVVNRHMQEKYNRRLYDY